VPRVLTLSALLGVALVATAAPALAQDNKIYRDFKNNGQVNPCNYSKGQLQKGLKDLPPDIQQYAPGLADQLRRPCAAAPAAPPAAPPPDASKAAVKAVVPTAAGGPAAPAVPAPPAPKAKVRRAINAAAPAVSTNPGGIDVPRWLQLALLAMGASLVAFFLAVRYGGLEPESVTRPMRAALAEGGDVFASLRDRLRLV
jgi:hypothetical protein